MSEKAKFKLNNLKVVHYYMNSRDMAAGELLKTSIELSSNYNYENNEEQWTKTISHTYRDIEFLEKIVTDDYEEILNDNSLIKLLEENDLRELKNNYFSESNPDAEHWEIIYNDDFKIIGTYDHQVEIINNIFKALDMKTLIKKEIELIESKRKSYYEQ